MLFHSNMLESVRPQRSVAEPFSDSGEGVVGDDELSCVDAWQRVRHGQTVSSHNEMKHRGFVGTFVAVPPTVRTSRDYGRQSWDNGVGAETLRRAACCETGLRRGETLWLAWIRSPRDESSSRFFGGNE